MSIINPSSKDIKFYYKHQKSSHFWTYKLPIWLVSLVISFFLIVPLTAQLQQSGGGGSNASVGATGSTAPASATQMGAAYNTTLPTLTNGQMGAEQVDANGRQIIVGAGVAGTAAGGVVSVQGVASGTPIPVSGTFWQATQPVSGTVSAGINAGTNLIGYTRAQNGCSTTVYESGMAYLPTTSTAVTATTTCVTLLALTNGGATSQTITITDGSTNCNSAACPVLSSFVLPANSNVLLPLYGMKFTTGLKWSTTTANQVMGDVIGNQ